MKIFSKAGAFGLLLISLLLAPAAYAEIWENDLTIKEVSFYYDGLYRLKVVVNEPTSTGCANEVTSVFMRSEASRSKQSDGIQTLLQQAIATDAKVDLAYVCHSSYGNVLHGVTLKVVN